MKVDNLKAANLKEWVMADDACSRPAG